MSPEDIRVLFLPFGRGSHARRMAKGTGLGMCVVKEIIEAHQGTIAVQSQPGKGTTVEVALPLAAP
jgi:signal transduction histidine kinase